MPHVDRTVFQFSFCNSPEHAMPLSHRCCISSSSVFVAPLSVEVIRANCNLKHAVTVWHLLAHGVGGIFFITAMFFGHYPIMTGLWRDSDFDDAIMTRLRRDSDYNDAIAACVFPDSISRCAFYCQGVSWEHRWFPWRLNMPYE